MSAILQRLQELAGPIAAELSHVDVPEWPEPDGKPLRVYFRPATVGEMSEVQKLHPADAVAQEVRIVINKALDADGKRIFQMAEMTEILALKTTIYSGFRTIANAITGAQLAAGEAEKN